MRRLPNQGYRFAFSGGNNVTLRGSRNPNWGWVDGHGQAWWDAQQQVNRPHGWAFRNINTGVIRDMKLWKVCPSIGVIYSTEIDIAIATSRLLGVSRPTVQTISMYSTIKSLRCLIRR